MSKEFYSIARLAAEWRPREHSRGEAFSFRSSALLLLDLQDYFFHPDSPAFLPAAPPILHDLRRLMTRFEQAGRPIILTRHVDDPDPSSPMNRWWQRRIESSDPMSRVVPSMENECRNAKIVVKQHYDAFLGTKLEDYLRMMGVSRIAIGGVMTHLCCETTARSAFMRGFVPFFLLDGTATIDRLHHEATVLNLSHGFARIVTAKEILHAFE